MKIYGGIYFDEQGLSTSMRAMHMQTEVLHTLSENIINFSKVGYKRKTPVISSFAEHIGVHALSKIENPEVGRITKTKNPLDLAITEQGSFKYLTPEGVKLTRDGRFKLDKDGNLLTIENYKVLGNTGEPIQLHIVPKELRHIKISSNGDINVLNEDTLLMERAGTIAVVSATGDIVESVDIKQGYVEKSNVSMHQEPMEMVAVRRNFEANREMYIKQNLLLSKTIQQLSS